MKLWYLKLVEPGHEKLILCTYFCASKISYSLSLFLEDWLGTRRKINQERLQNLQKTCQAHPELSLHEEMHNAQAKSLYTSPAESYPYQGHNYSTCIKHDAVVSWP